MRPSPSEIGPVDSVSAGCPAWRKIGLRWTGFQSIIPTISIGFSGLTNMLFVYKSPCHIVEGRNGSSFGKTCSATFRESGTPTIRRPLFVDIVRDYIKDVAA
jgi:hypothetical protein